MKNKLIQTILISFLCLIIFAGCTVVPSSTPTPTPSPAEPTPTSIPYGEVLDVTIQINKNPQFSWKLAQLLLEKFSLRLVEYNYYSHSSPDILLANVDPSYVNYEIHARDWTRKLGEAYGGVNYLSYLKDMPNYSSLLQSKEMIYTLYRWDGDEYSLPLTGIGRDTNINYYLWLYNEAWFTKYNYSIPETMEELVDLLIEHKTNVDPSAQPILIDKQEMMATRLPIGVFATYGLDYNSGFKRVDGDVYDYTMTDSKVVQALDVLKKINDNSLAGDSCLNYDDIWTSDLSECAVFYDANILTPDKDFMRYIECEGLNWKIAQTQFSYNGTPYVTSPTSSISNFTQIDWSLINLLVIREDIDTEIKNRLIDYIDWCSTDEGIIASEFGIEGEDYTFDENGKLVILKEAVNNSAAIRVVHTNYMADVIYDYGYSIYDRYLSTSFLGADRIEYINKTDISVLPQPEIRYTLSTEGKNTYNNLVAVSKQFFNDYVNGTKTADDFSEYLWDLENAGLSDFLKGAKDYYNALYEEFKDYLPDSLK